MLLSRAAMTSRLERLEDAGMLTRVLDPRNRRSFRTTLTETGREVVDRAMTAHVANVEPLLDALPDDDLAVLDDLLSRLLVARE